MQIELRPARLDDGDDLFAWRNDPDTCASSRSTATINREQHALWMQFNVRQGYPEHLVLIAESDSENVGVVRFDAIRRDVMSFEASITIAPEHRKKGLAGGVLKEACEYMREYTLLAVIRRENVASRRIFESCGFDQVSPDEPFVKYRRYPQP